MPVPVETLIASLARKRWATPMVMAFVLPFYSAAAAAADAGPTNAAPLATMVQRAGTVEINLPARSAWSPATNQQRLFNRDRLRTLALSQASVQLHDRSVLRLGERAELEMLPPRSTTARARFSLSQGQAYFLHRNEPRDIEVDTPVVRAGIDGTEFNLLVGPDGTTLLSLIDGHVTLANALGTLTLASGEQGLVQPGQPPVKTARIDTRSALQWTLYYPGVLDPDDLSLTTLEESVLATALSAYREGDLLGALAAYPAERTTQARSPHEELFHAALRLSAGQVTNDTEFVAGLDRLATHPAADALQRLVAAVSLATNAAFLPATNASQRLAQSYLLQSRRDLRAALEEARRATADAPGFGFAWARVAELEFSFGRNRPAAAALERALQLAPGNAQAHALLGFVRLGQERFAEAERAFNEAIRLDPRLANGWLGRGLGRLQRRDTTGGLADLQMASAMEPTRWLVRSYLARAFQSAADEAGSIFNPFRAAPAPDAGTNADSRDERHDGRRGTSRRTRLIELAEAELALARREDPLDPTPWLYSALLHERENRPIEAVRDLQESIERNDQRQLFRSRLLLDEDRAVRSVNLARIYERAGLPELALQQAARAVEDDYFNYSAHGFLANTFNARRDPRRVSLRDEEAWANQQFLANLFTPVDGGPLSRNVSQLEYSSAFRPPPFGLLSLTEYLSTGDFRQTASHFGRVGQLGYAVDTEYLHSDGDHANNDFERLESSIQLKYDATSRDAVLLQIRHQDFSGGDLAQYQDATNARPALRFTEQQEPLIFAGYHRRWNEHSETIFLASRLVNDFRYSDRASAGLVLVRSNSVSPAEFVDALTLYDTRHQTKFEAWSAELNQIFRTEWQTLQLGGRIQWGRFDNRSTVTNVGAYALGPSLPFFQYPQAGTVESSVERHAVYVYDTLNITRQLRLTAGLAWDHLRHPRNFRRIPVDPVEDSASQLSPKAALVWTPTSNWRWRAAWTRSLSGASFEDSVRLEPTQLAGFTQAYRNVIPESLVGSLSGVSYDQAGAGVDWTFAPASHFGLEYRRLTTDHTRHIGVYDLLYDPIIEIVPSSTRERLDYEEQSLAVSLTHPLSATATVGARYRCTLSDLERRLPNALSNPLSTYPNQQRHRATFHQPEAWIQQDYPSGLHGRLTVRGLLQDNRAGTRLDDEAVVQLDLTAGYRFWRNQAELTLGLLNATDANYRLNPLTPHADYPRERAFLTRFRLNF